MLPEALHTWRDANQGPLTPWVLAKRSAGRRAVPMTARGEAGLELNCDACEWDGPGEPSALSYNRLQSVSRPESPWDPARPKLPPL
mmetsp:Transcript_106987/g.284677  ORF Transcript_106987/g.284677 Transcript_106987/m.284677 type:complete len:86 (+) Transcript_106987:110-367(+)